MNFCIICKYTKKCNKCIESCIYSNIHNSFTVILYIFVIKTNSIDMYN